ncbi:hypothetical protein GCM10010840_36740 [Deinococcus aerolatus]|uniref:Replication protein n=1 Tax=Deinococcus aerolatus TaxID=522487 RepID=A0ABQ2GHB9_9DEIO|nr:hypothetical protein [Deinococcus aerolatus]GGL95311.1 hypothetical protein GCM10010840_36740 [Deinococcus aerolatus]
MQTHSFADTINRARLAITGQASTAAAAPLPAPQSTQRPVAPPAPSVRPVLPSADAVRGSCPLSPGAARLWTSLHDLARHVALVRGHAVLPTSLTFHLPAVIVAALVDYSERHLYRLADELRAAGLIDERGHVAQVGHLRRYDGTLWAIRLQPDAPPPRLRWWDFQHDWRPDFAEDYSNEKGAWRAVQEAMSEPLSPTGQNAVQELGNRWAAATKLKKTPAGDGSDMRPGRVLYAVARDLPALLHLHPRQRHREVSRLASDLAHVLNEPGRYRQHCAAIYRALDAENEQRPGLSVLALQLHRLAADLAELAPWRKPGAVLASRLA